MYYGLILVLLIRINNRKIQHVGTYNLTNRVLGQIREKSDLGLSLIDLPLVGQIGKPRLHHFFPALTSTPGSKL